MRARSEQVLRFLREWQPDVLCLQETRILEAKLPLLEFRGLGYQCWANSPGQRAGVATLVRLERGCALISRGASELELGRRVRVRVDSVDIDNVYVPTRKALGKVEFLRLLLREYAEPNIVGVLCGDFNICSDERDYASSAQLAEADRFPSREEDLAFQALRATGLDDCFRRHCQDAGRYTWFDYRPWTLRRNYGMRLDYVFTTPLITCREARHLMEPRAWAKPSDHLPVLVELEWR